MLRQLCTGLTDHIDIDLLIKNDFDIQATLEASVELRSTPETSVEFKTTLEASVNFDALLVAVLNILLNDPTGVALKDLSDFSLETSEVDAEGFLNKITAFISRVKILSE